MGNKGEQEKLKRRKGVSYNKVKERNLKRRVGEEDTDTSGGEDITRGEDKRHRIDNEKTTVSRQKVSEKRRGRESVLHTREVRERKEREKRERDSLAIKEKEKAGVKYWKTKFSEMAEKGRREIGKEIHGAREHILRIERGRAVVSLNPEKQEETIARKEPAEEKIEKMSEKQIEKCSLRVEPEIIEKNEGQKIVKHRKNVNPRIMKISEIFENRKKETEQEKTGENVTKLKNSFESMMRDTEMRKSDHKIVKKRQRKITVDSNEKHQRNILENWIGGGSGVKRKGGQEKTETVAKKYRRNGEDDQRAKSKSKSTTEKMKKGLELQKHGEVVKSYPNSRHRKCVASEKLLDFC